MVDMPPNQIRYCDTRFCSMPEKLIFEGFEEYEIRILSVYLK